MVNKEERGITRDKEEEQVEDRHSEEETEVVEKQNKRAKGRVNEEGVRKARGKKKQQKRWKETNRRIENDSQQEKENQKIEHNKKKEVGGHEQSTLKERLDKIRKKRKKKLPKKRTNVRVKMSKQISKETDGKGAEERTADEREKQNDTEEQTVQSKRQSDMEKNQHLNCIQEESANLQHIDPGGNRGDLGGENQQHEKSKEEGIGDNMSNNPDESFSLPTAIKNHPGINLIVDLNNNLIETYNSNGKDVEDGRQDGNMENLNQQEKEETVQEMSQEQQKHLKEVSDRNGLSPGRRGRNKQKKDNRKERSSSSNFRALSCKGERRKDQQTQNVYHD
ncbi:uncharacterized protein LOC132639872 [Lycium barbarum]|uniref:uncharacterized protein LOC132639872 n=1 Tax=Lycium barbarum TaxID=112863 RepID=UPI00293ED6A5|nr:uncharacterized protein LOC132639872 [Lycium barbarum]